MLAGGTPPDVQFTLCKVDAETSMAIGKSSVDGSTAVYGIYSDHACKNKVAEITIGEDGMGSVKLKSGTYYAKEISAPTGYALDETVYTLSGSGRRTAAGDRCLLLFVQAATSVLQVNLMLNFGRTCRPLHRWCIGRRLPAAARRFRAGCAGSLCCPCRPDRNADSGCDCGRFL